MFCNPTENACTNPKLVPPPPAFSAKEAVAAKDEVPNKEPVIPDDTFNDPVISVLPDMSKVAEGFVVPIPTFPSLTMVILTLPFVSICTCGVVDAAFDDNKVIRPLLVNCEYRSKLEDPIIAPVVVNEPVNP